MTINPHTILEAAIRAVGGTGNLQLSIQEHPDLRGLSIGDGIRQAYLFPAGHGITIEVWRKHDRDAYLVCSSKTIENAIQTALIEIMQCDGSDISTEVGAAAGPR